jgi:hypothetical protein
MGDAYLGGILHARRDDPQAFGLLLDTMTRADVYALCWDYACVIARMLPATTPELEQHALHAHAPR